jgi:anti-sigma regulatory factor (Ser/Thr protein kinase)
VSVADTVRGAGFVVEPGPPQDPSVVERLVAEESDGVLRVVLRSGGTGDPDLAMRFLLPAATVEVEPGPAVAAVPVLLVRGSATRPLVPGEPAVALEPGDAVLAGAVRLRFHPWERDAEDGFRAFLRADFAAAAAARASFEAYCAGRGAPQEAVHALALALQEILDNVVEHAYRNRPGCVVLVEATVSGDHASVVVRDRGPAFDPLSVPPPESVSSLTDRRIGGLGVHLVRQLCDEVRWERRGGENRLVLGKRFAAA